MLAGGGYLKIAALRDDLLNACCIFFVMKCSYDKLIVYWWIEYVFSAPCFLANSYCSKISNCEKGKLERQREFIFKPGSHLLESVEIEKSSTKCPYFNKILVREHILYKTVLEILVVRTVKMKLCLQESLVIPYICSRIECFCYLKAAVVTYFWGIFCLFVGNLAVSFLQSDIVSSWFKNGQYLFFECFHRNISPAGPIVISRM